VISYDYWTRQFGRDPSVLGKAINLNSNPYTTVGVAPHEFFGVEPGPGAGLLDPDAGCSRTRPREAVPDMRSLLPKRNRWWLMSDGAAETRLDRVPSRSSLTWCCTRALRPAWAPRPSPKRFRMWS
jgi:hypothetical protein